MTNTRPCSCSNKSACFAQEAVWRGLGCFYIFKSPSTSAVTDKKCSVDTEYQWAEKWVGYDHTTVVWHSSIVSWSKLIWSHFSNSLCSALPIPVVWAFLWRRANLALSKPSSKEMVIKCTELKIFPFLDSNLFNIQISIQQDCFVHCFHLYSPFLKLRHTPEQKQRG